MRRYLFVPILIVVLIAAACSSGSEPPSGATKAVTASPAETGESRDEQPAGSTEGLSTRQRQVADAMYSVLVDDNRFADFFAESETRCVVDGLVGALSDDRLAELGVDGPSFTALYEDRYTFAMGDLYEITESEAADIVDAALACLDWRALLAEIAVAESATPEQASCMDSEISDEGVRAAVAAGLISESDEVAGLFEVELERAYSACIDTREVFFAMLVEEQGLSEGSARCVVDGLPDQVIEMMSAGQEPEDDEEAVLEMMGELIALQNRCLTPEELELMGDSGFQSAGADPGVGTGACPPADGSGPQVLDFDGPQPMCLDPSGQYTAVFDTTAGEMRIALDMVNTPITANNFAVLALYHYYDNTQLFRTDPGIGIIQGGAPHTNSPSDPGPGYTIPDEGSGFTYEPGQLVMARTAAPDSASAQFFFAVNEQTALLNSQGTYVVFGQMDDASLAVAEAILASHVDQPDNPLGGGPEPPVFVNSVTIEETG